MRDPDMIPTLLSSPGTRCAGGLPHPPRLERAADGALRISIPYEDEQGRPAISASDPPQLVVEVVVLKRRGWVVVDAGLDVFLMTEAEYNAQFVGL